jgi:hypothetical protein
MWPNVTPDCRGQSIKIENALNSIRKSAGAVQAEELFSLYPEYPPGMYIQTVKIRTKAANLG